MAQTSPDASDDRPPRAPFLAVAFAASAAFCAISLSGGSVAKYRWSAIFLVPIVWAIFLLRRRLALRPLHFALLAVGLLAHDMGAFGWYQRKPLGLQYDWYVHFFFGVVGGLVVARTLEQRLALRGAPRALLSVLVIVGLGAVHEIIEAASTARLGPEYGMLIVGADDPYDTQEDMFNNLLGASLAQLLHGRRRTDGLDAPSDRGRRS
ncbi:MAG TPA: DUF2238 domain-containing protein [Planctomycetota bacterium]|nr:DUF2238 domain-containing protein [Planctomycetota bacterium]